MVSISFGTVTVRITIMVYIMAMSYRCALPIFDLIFDSTPQLDTPVTAPVAALPFLRSVLCVALTIVGHMI